MARRQCVQHRRRTCAQLTGGRTASIVRPHPLAIGPDPAIRDAAVAAGGQVRVVGDQQQRGAGRGAQTRTAGPSPPSPVAWSRLPVGSSASSSRGSRREGAGQRHALLLAAGKLAGQVGQPMRQARRRPAPPRPAPSASRAPGQFQRHRDVLQRGHGRDQVKRLEHDADRVAAQPGQRVLVHRGDVLPGQARRCRQLARSSPASTISRLVLPDPEGPTMPDRLAGVDVEVDAAQDVDRPGGGRHGQVQVPDLHQRRCGAGGNAETAGWHPWRQHMASARRLAESRDRACWPLITACFARSRRRAAAPGRGCWCWAIRCPPATACRTPRVRGPAWPRPCGRTAMTCTIIDGAVSGDTTAGGLARLDWVLATAPTRRSSNSAPMTGCAASIPKEMEANLTRDPRHAGGAAYPGAADRHVCAAQSRPGLRARLPRGVRPAGRRGRACSTTRSSCRAWRRFRR